MHTLLHNIILIHVNCGVRLVCSVRCAVCDGRHFISRSVRQRNVRQCARQRVAVLAAVCCCPAGHAAVWGGPAVRQCAALCADVCGSARGSVRLTGSVQGSAWQCAAEQQCAAVWQCGSVSSSAAMCIFWK
jgi:hypothetical protein